MNYINTQTNQYPVTENDIRLAHPNTSFPTPFVAPENYALVFASPQPEHNYVTHLARETTPVLSVKGHYEQQWEVVSKFIEYTDEQGVVHTVEEQEQTAIAQDLATRRVNISGVIKSTRDNKIQSGGYEVEGKWFHSDTVSRSQQTGLYLMGESVPAGLMWKTMDGSFVEMTPVLAQKIFFAAAIQDSVLFQYAESLHQQVKESNNPEQIDIVNNWPATFQTSAEAVAGVE